MRVLVLRIQLRGFKRQKMPVLRRLTFIKPHIFCLIASRYIKNLSCVEGERVNAAAS